MAKKKKIKNLEVESQFENLEDTETNVTDSSSPGEETTFAEAKGSEANQHAKKLAKAKSKKAKEDPAHVLYTQKGAKVLKVVVKPGMTHSIYVGQNKDKKHKAILGPMIEGWKKQGIWAHEHELKEKCAAIQESFKK